MYAQGILIVIEGLNGSGKTTIIDQLKKHFASIQVEASFYKFPDRNGLNGKKIDDYLKGSIVIDSKYDILDMFAANRNAVQHSIRDDLHKGKVVICDRYIFSAIAYQIPERVVQLNTIANYCNVIGYFDKSMPAPSMTYLIDGDHLLKRGIVSREIFHYTGAHARGMKHKLHSVIRNYTRRFRVLRNQIGQLDEVVKFIAFDIDVLLRARSITYG